MCGDVWTLPLVAPVAVASPFRSAPVRDVPVPRSASAPDELCKVGVHYGGTPPGGAAAGGGTGGDADGAALLYSRSKSREDEDEVGQCRLGEGGRPDVCLSWGESAGAGAHAMPSPLHRPDDASAEWSEPGGRRRRTMAAQLGRRSRGEARGNARRQRVRVGAGRRKRQTTTRTTPRGKQAPLRGGPSARDGPSFSLGLQSSRSESREAPFCPILPIVEVRLDTTRQGGGVVGCLFARGMNEMPSRADCTGNSPRMAPKGGHLPTSKTTTSTPEAGAGGSHAAEPEARGAVRRREMRAVAAIFAYQQGPSAGRAVQHRGVIG
ncbi:hypothetical protein THAOC_06808 [Thalassiosira oceanica]|uniref:Uncharacterized protein n=1 Tax=Thalassiosira oceanica TaxID=159749 RepID=K0TE68_THAOC|nr:hypothetical protein THAOC_06808 [Thalassiosira oceanica]|eukprot:EJK71726.1 hypothetical protein THAOC_06808 [Thalassiosira oceanica]